MMTYIPGFSLKMISMQSLRGFIVKLGSSSKNVAPALVSKNFLIIVLILLKGNIFYFILPYVVLVFYVLIPQVPQPVFPCREWGIGVEFVIDIDILVDKHVDLV